MDEQEYKRLNPGIASLDILDVSSYYTETGFWVGHQRGGLQVNDPYDYNFLKKYGYHADALIGWIALLGKTNKEAFVITQVKLLIGDILLKVGWYLQNEIPGSTDQNLSLLLESILYAKGCEGLIAVDSHSYLLLIAAVLLAMRRRNMWEATSELMAKIQAELSEVSTPNPTPCLRVLLDYSKFLNSPCDMPLIGKIPILPPSFADVELLTCAKLAELGYESLVLTDNGTDVEVPFYLTSIDSPSGDLRMLPYAHRDSVGVRIDEAIITPEGYVLVDEKFLIHDILLTNIGKCPYNEGENMHVRAIDGGKAFLQMPQNDIEYIDDSCILLGSRIHRIGHFQLDTMPHCRIIDALRQKKLIKDRPSILYKPVWEVASDVTYYIHDQLFEPGDRRSLAKKFYKVKSLWILSTPLHSSNAGYPHSFTLADPDRSISSASYEYAKDKLDNAIKATNAGGLGPDRIYISRDDALNNNDIRSRILNLPEFESLLSSRGFAKISLGSITLLERMRLFGSAKIVCGVGGSGLFSIVFAPKSSVLIDIQAQSDSQQGAFNIASGIGYKHCPYQIEVIDGVAWMRIDLDYLSSVI